MFQFHSFINLYSPLSTWISFNCSSNDAPLPCSLNDAHLPLAFTESPHTTTISSNSSISRSGKEVNTMELLQYVMFALLASMAIAVLFLLVSDYAYYGLCMIVVLLVVAILCLSKAMKDDKAANLLR